LTRRFFPEEQLSVDEALEMYTINAAWASCEEKEKGSIEEGKIANLTVLSEDPHMVPQIKIQDIIIEMTIINGKICYTRSA
jgi:predicted amidohydrolase YtcJ